MNAQGGVCPVVGQQQRKREGRGINTQASKTSLYVDGVFWYTKHVHYTLVWI
jgi:hypothetical protein